MNLINWLTSRTKPAIHLTLLVVLATVVLLLPAGTWDLRGPDEGRYTQIAKELLHSNNWLALRVMGKPYDQKPPLAFWLFAAAIKANGGQPASGFLRAPSALAAIGLLIITYQLGRRRGGNTTGMLAGLMLLSSLSFLDDAPAVELNMLYAFFTTASLAVWLLMPPGQARLSWPRWAAMWLLLAAAFFVKGPLAILVVLGALAGAAWAQRSWQPFKQVRILPGLAMVLVLIGIWFLAQSRAFGSEFVQEQVSGETVGRFTKGDHGEPFWYYFPRLFTSVLGPWTILLIAGLYMAWKHRPQITPEAGAYLGWMGFAFVVLLIANGKRVPYLLPLLPAACVVAADYTALRLAPYRMAPRWQRLLIGVLLLLAAALAIAGAVMSFPGLLPARLTDPSVINWPRLYPLLWLAAAVVMANLAWSYLKSTRTWYAGVWTMALAILLMQLLDFALVRPALDPGKSTRAFSSQVTKALQAAHENTVITLPLMAEPEFHVYGDYNVKSLSKKNMDPTDPTLPRVLLLHDEERETSGPWVMNAGYKPFVETPVTDRIVTIYVKDAPAQP